jgi:hypothetical protein
VSSLSFLFRLTLNSLIRIEVLSVALFARSGLSLKDIWLLPFYNLGRIGGD